MSDASETDFTRRKFTIPEQLDVELERVAAEHYGGNISLCLRQAIQDHRATLRGDSQVTLRTVRGKVDALEAATDDIVDLLEELTTNIQETTEYRSGSRDLQREAERFETAQTIQAELLAADHPLRLDDLIDRVSAPPRNVQRGVEFLLDTGAIHVTTSEPPRYCPVTMTSGDLR